VGKVFDERLSNKVGKVFDERLSIKVERKNSDESFVVVRLVVHLFVSSLLDKIIRSQNC